MSRGARNGINYLQGDLVNRYVRSRRMASMSYSPGWRGVVRTGIAASGLERARADCLVSRRKDRSCAANRMLIRGFNLLGVRAGEAARRNPALAEQSAREIAAWTAAGHLKPHVSATFPLAQAQEALQQMADRRASAGLHYWPLTCADSFGWGSQFQDG